MELKIIAAVLVTISLLFGTGVEALAPEEVKNPSYSYSENWINEVTLVEGVS